MLPTPREIFASFEKGEIEREELHAMMALHARQLIGEMEEDRMNPAAALIENLQGRRVVSRLTKKHGVRLLREVLVAMSDARDFAAAGLLWNAGHPDVPLHCFFRIRRTPVFRLLSIDVTGNQVVVVVEHGFSAPPVVRKETIYLTRDHEWRLRAE